MTRHEQVESQYTFLCDAGIKHVIDLINIVPDCVCLYSCEGSAEPWSPYVLVVSVFPRTAQVDDLLAESFDPNDYRIEASRPGDYSMRIAFRNRDVVLAATDAVNSALPMYRQFRLDYNADAAAARSFVDVDEDHEDVEAW